MKQRMLFVVFLLFLMLTKAAGHDPCYDSFNPADIDVCLFNNWRAVGVLSADPIACNGNNDVQLCYGDKITGTNNVLFAVCYNNETRIPKFTGHVLHGQGTVGVPNMVPDGKEDNNWRTDDSGLLAIADQATNADYATAPPNLNLAKGHLTPAGDFSSNNKEKSFTLVLTNSAPQWQPFNAGNWAVVEQAIRSYAKSTPAGKTLYIVTGTGGRAKFNDQEIDKLNGNVATPRYFWKAVCDPVKKQSIVFVAENEPGITDPSEDNTGCELYYTPPTGGVKITKRIPQKRKFGVIKCSSLADAVATHQDFSLPPFSAMNCKPTEKGKFLDQLLADKLRVFNN